MAEGEGTFSGDTSYEETMTLDAETIDELNREELVKHLQNLAVPVDKKDSQERLKAKLKRALLGDGEEEESKAGSVDPNLVAIMEMMHRQHRQALWQQQKAMELQQKAMQEQQQKAMEHFLSALKSDQ